MYARVGLFAFATSLVIAPMTSNPQQPALAVVQKPFSAPSECRSKSSTAELFLRPRIVRKALSGRQHVRILAVGSSSTVGVGASSPTAAYVARLEPTLEGALKGVDFEVVGRGVSGEVAQGAADRMKKEVEETKPDLVVWQVGTNDAIRHVSIDSFKNCLRKTLAWLADNKIDAVLVNPQHGAALTRDDYYLEVVKAISEVAQESGVLLVDRFEAMRELQKERGDAFFLTADNLHMNDSGHRCMAEHLARAIVGGLMEAEAGQASRFFSIRRAWVADWPEALPPGPGTT